MTIRSLSSKTMRTRGSSSRANLPLRVALRCAVHAHAITLQHLAERRLRGVGEALLRDVEQRRWRGFGHDGQRTTACRQAGAHPAAERTWSQMPRRDVSCGTYRRANFACAAGVGEE